MIRAEVKPGMFTWIRFLVGPSEESLTPCGSLCMRKGDWEAMRDLLDSGAAGSAWTSFYDIESGAHSSTGRALEGKDLGDAGSNPAGRTT